METDSLINISNSTLTTPDRRGSLNSNFPNEPGKLEPGKLEPGKLLTLDEALEASDEVRKEIPTFSRTRNNLSLNNCLVQFSTGFIAVRNNAKEGVYI